MRATPPTLGVLSVLGFLLLLTLPTLARAQATTGAVAGHVLDTTGQPLVGAEVKLEGTSFVSSTDQNGRFRIAEIPPGDYTIIVDFLGFGSDRKTITITAGDVVSNDVRLALTFGEQVEVSAPLLEGQAKALNQQRVAPNIVNVVSADQLSGFPDPNVAEAAQRVPGIGLQRDDGEGEVMLIRGVDPKLNSVTMNGERIPSTESATRTVNSISIASEILQTIEVSKSLRPDLDGDAIGGVVNFVTKQAPEVAKAYGTFEVGYNDLRAETNPKGSLTYGRRFASSRLGVIASGSAHDENRANETIENEYTVTQQLDRVTFRDEYSNYQRYSGNLAMDWLSPNSTLTFRSTWTRQDQAKVRRRERHERIPAGIVGTGGRIRTELRDRDRTRDVFTNGVSGTWILQNEWSFEYGVAYNISDREEPDTALNRYEQGSIRYAPFVDPDNEFYINPNPLNRDTTRSTWRFNQVEQLFTTDRDVVGNLNLRIPLGGGAPGYMKYGFKVRDKHKENDQNLFNYAGSGLPTLSQVGTELSNPDFLDGFYRSGPYLSPETMRGFFDTYPLTVTKTLSTDSFDYDATELVTAGYGMVELSFTSRLMIMGGLRYEYTRSDYTGKQIVGTVVQPVSGSANYGDALPMAHLRFAIDDKTNLRFAITRSIARPSYYDLVPYEFIDTEADTISLGNPDLKETDATNIDAFVERYLSGVGVVGGGFFYKHLTDPIFVSRRTSDYLGEPYRVTQPINGESGDITGLEVYYQQRLGFLPGAFNGFGVLANYVYVTSEAQLPERPETSTFPGQSDHSGNFALSYENWGFTGRIAYNYSGEYLFELGEVALMDIVKMGHSQWDMSLSQRLSPHFTLYANVLNLNDARDHEYWGVESQPARDEKYSWWGAVGIRVEF